MNEPTSLKTHLKRKNLHNPHKGHSWSTKSGDQGDCTTGSKDNYYIEKFYQDIAFLPNTQKQTQRVKVGKQRTMAPPQERSIEISIKRIKLRQAIYQVQSS